MAAGELVFVTRRFSVDGRTVEPGHGRRSVVEVSEAVADRMEDASPPYGRRITEEELASLEEADVDATEGARELAEEHGLDLQMYAGRGSGEDGRIYQRDVEGWLDHG